MDMDAYIPLLPGQKFHHKGKNGVEYFKLTVVEKEDGSIYPMTETAPACNVVPLELDEEGHIVAMYLMQQKGRLEMGENSVALKSVGSFCKTNEGTKECALRSLEEKVAIHAEKDSLIFCGPSYGFGDQFRFPIDLYVVKDFAFLDVPVMEGCKRIRMTIEEIAIAQKERRFFNSETIDIIASALLRNATQDIYPW